MITKAVQEKINRIRNYIIRHPEHYVDEISKNTDISIMSIRRLEGSDYFKLGDRYYTRFEKKVKDLYKTYSKTEIAHMLGVSPTKISVAISLITKRDPYRKQKHIKKEKVKKEYNKRNACYVKVVQGKHRGQMGYFEEAGTGFNIITFKNGKQEKIKVKPHEVEEIVKHQSLKGGLKNERL